MIWVDWFNQKESWRYRLRDREVAIQTELGVRKGQEPRGVGWKVEKARALVLSWRQQTDF